MEIIRVTMERLEFVYKRFTTILVVCFIALPVLFMISMMSQNSKFDLSAVFGVKVQNAIALDSKYEAYQPTSIPVDKLVDNTLAYGFEPKYESSQPSSTLESKLLNRTVAPKFGKLSDSEYESSLPTSIPEPDDKQLNGTLSSRFIGVSVSGNESSQPTSISNDNLLNGTLGPKFVDTSSSRNNSFQSKSMDKDKLLDGLILPGFGERSCLSRYQSILYRRISPHKPSPFLLSKLRDYEGLHKRCGPHSISYNRTLKVLKSSHVGITRECKYIVWRPDNGLGNRMASMASSFLYALLSNRVLLVDHGTDMADLFCEPFPNTSWLLPKDFPLRNQFHNSQLRYAHSLRGMLEKGRINKSMEATPPYLYLTLKKREDNLDKQVFYCDQSQVLLQKVPWLILLSEQYFVPSFFLIPSFKEEVSKLFPEKETVFHHLGRYLFNPSNRVWRQLITRFYDAYLAKADKRVGLQIRVFHANAAHIQTVMDQISECTVKKKLLPKVDTTKSASSSTKNQKPSKVILVASLYSEFYMNLSNMYLAKPDLSGEVIGVYQPSQEGYQHRGDNIHNMKAWAEIYLLSLCDVLVTSAWSTFGYVAQSLGGLKPWILQKPKLAGHGIFVPCKRATSMEPCFHYPFSYDCKSRNNLDAAALVPYIRQCEDRELGVKLFNDHQKL
ncbi:probable fucosyltransferase 8 isoform X2 [Jatropha curcas]|uniref:probable fucosyltransferase 8 isoform X2 n=1 Tax=Jatropha curcas TaxID=180498 RepID=UPI0005FAF7F0|nr:probable fucosyltransferase 8 isoform X2 [Jatropha curcas]